MDTLVKQKLDNFFEKYRTHKFKKGEILINADENSIGVFYLTQGVVKRYAISEKGEELTLNIYKPISFFPISHAINNTPNKHYYEALTNIEVHKAPKEEVVKFLQNEPEVIFDLLSRIYSGLDGLFLRMENLMAGDAKTRLTTELVIAAKRFGQKEKNQTTIDLKLTEKDLAAQTGIARETVSRVIADLKNKGLISFNKSILTINDLKKLTSEISLD